MGGTNIKKYLKYAFGEIVLVVIGILIAVGINNWNQRKQLHSARAYSGLVYRFYYGFCV